jgi:hypothetical protein
VDDNPYEATYSRFSNQFKITNSESINELIPYNQLRLLWNLFFQVLYDLLMVFKDPEQNMKPYMSPYYFQYVKETYIDYYEKNTL